MDEGNSFLELIKRVRAADPSAAVELVRRYEPAIRRIVRLQMRDPRLRRILDSMDVCQSVLASFFLRAATGQYDLNQPAQLLRLLAVMARNKVASQARTSYVMRREPPLCGAADASTARRRPGRVRITRRPGGTCSKKFAAGCPTMSGGWRIAGRIAGSGARSRLSGRQSRCPAQAAGPRP